MSRVDILFQDDDIVVFSKPAGMIVNKADTAKNVETLQDIVEDIITFPTASESEFVKRGGIVHRLDKETSGVIVVAKNEDAFVALQKQFKNRDTKKTYTALVHGKIGEEGQVNAPIGRLPWNRMRFGVIPQGRESFTEFKVIEYKTHKRGKESEILSLVEVYPKTGRTHQIRVHFQYLHFPIFADDLYAGRKVKAKDRKELGRHFLHASKLSILHPRTGEEMEFVAPLSPELVDFMSQLS